MNALFASGPPSTRVQIVASLALYSVLSVIWSWPLASDPLNMLVCRQVDGFGQTWFVAQPLRLISQSSSFPEGEWLNRSDSFIIWGIGAVLTPLGGPMAAGSLCALLGPALTGLAADRCAVAWGASWPWSIVAGLAFGFSSMAANALLEGHTYAILDPWTPLMLGALPAALRPDPDRRAVLLVVVGWSGALLTSAYIAITASLMLVPLMVGSWLRQETRTRTLFGVLSCIGVIGAPYVGLFALHGPSTRASQGTLLYTYGAMRTGSATLAGLLAWSPGSDVMQHSMAPVIPMTVTMLAIFAASGVRASRRLIAVGVFAVLLSLGPEVDLPGIGRFPGLLAPIAQLPAASFFRFPARILPAAFLAFGVVGAQALTVVAPGALRWAVLALFAAVIDAIVGSGAPFRTRPIPFPLPSAYTYAPPGALLELFPDRSVTSPEFMLYLIGRTCGYAALHGEPVLQECLSISQGTDHRHLMAGWLFGRIFDGPDDIAVNLAVRGVASVAFHPDLFLTGERDLIRAGLEAALGPPLAESADAGERVVLFAVPGVVASRSEAVNAWQEALP
ncbi:MAG: hypothetical protein EXR69_10875 [Myxococcales bacterium]|nr:hypothetical protein [Myxococcales bacterium]